MKQHNYAEYTDYDTDNSPANELKEEAQISATNAIITIVAMMVHVLATTTTPTAVVSQLIVANNSASFASHFRVSNLILG